MSYTAKFFKSMNEAEQVADSNIKSLDRMAIFVPYAQKCGSPYTAIDLETANDYILTASESVRKCWYFACVTLIYVSVELLPITIGFLCVMTCCIKNLYCNGGVYEENNPDSDDTDVVVSGRDDHLKDIETNLV